MIVCEEMAIYMIPSHMKLREEVMKDVGRYVVLMTQACQRTIEGFNLAIINLLSFSTSVVLMVQGKRDSGS